MHISPSPFRPRIPAVLVVGSLLLGASAAIARAQSADDSPAPEPAPPAAAEKEQPVENPYAVPEGTDAQAMQSFVQKLMRLPAPDRTPEGLRDHFGKLRDAASELLGRPLDDETTLLLVRLKIGALNILQQLDEPKAEEAMQTFIVELKKDERPVIAAHGRLLEAELVLQRLRPGQPEVARRVVDHIVELLQEKPLTTAHVGLAVGASQTLEKLGETELAVSSNQVFAKYLRATERPEFVNIAEVLEGTARRLNLPGNPIKITGRTLQDEDFNIDQWKGKVVLVDFWATWCGPCVAEMPHLRELYDTHHEQGFEIVGVSLDDNPRRLQSFVELNELPWPILFDEAKAAQGQENPLAAYYGISSIPTMFLVNREGKVAATDVYGDRLDREIERLMAEEAPASTGGM